MRIILLCLLAAALNLSAAGRFDVRNFGALGDGTHDDTAAIQKALNAASRAEQFVLVGKMGGTFGPWGGDGPFSEVYFPEGTYRITGTLVYPGEGANGRKIALTGAGNAVISQESADKDIFYFSNVMRINMSGLTLKGGKEQLQIWTNNYDMSTVYFDNCKFLDAVGTAIVCRVPSEKGKLVPPYTVSWKNGLAELTAIPPGPGRGEFWNSTLLEVSNSEFRNCARVTDISCDLAVIRDTKVITPEKQVGPVFLLSNQVYLLRVEGTGSGEAYWIDLRSVVEAKALLFVNDCNFDSTNAWTLVRANPKPGYISSALCIADTKVKSGGGADGAIVYLAENTSPNLLSLRNVTDTSGIHVQAVKYAAELSEKDFAEKVRYYKQFSVDFSFDFIITDCSRNIDPVLTPGARKFISKPFIAQMDRLTRVNPPEFNTGDFPNVVNAAEYGVGSGKADESAAVEAALSAAAKTTPAKVIFPSKVIKIAKTIRIPDGVCLTSHGSVFFVAPEKMDAPLFVIDGNKKNALLNLGFVNGSSAISIDNAEGSEYLIDHCTFYDQSDVSVKARKKGAEDNSKVKIVRSRLAAMHGIDTDLAYQEIDTSWVMNDGRMHDSGYFTNRGGDLLLQYNLFVPILPSTEISNGLKDSGKFPNDPWGKNTRWVDNYGNFFSVGNRYGGEFCGMTLVRNFSPAATIMITQGFSFHGNLYTGKAFLQCEKIPKRLIVKDLVCSAESTAPNPSGITWKKPDGNWSNDARGITIFCSGIILHNPFAPGK